MNQQTSLPDGWEVVTPSSSQGNEPHIGPAQPGTASPPATADTPVTLGEVLEDPAAAFARIGHLIKRDASDPRTWLGIAAAYFGPKAIGAVWPVVAKAAGEIAPRQALGKTLQVGGRFVASPMKATGKAIEGLGDQLVATSPAAAAPAAGTRPVAPTSEQSAPASSAGSRSVPLGKSPQQLLNEEAIAARRAKVAQPPAAPAAPVRAKLTAEESKLYAQLRLQGKTDDQAKAVLEATRALKQSGPFAHLPTDFETAAEMTRRALSGQKSLIGAYAPTEPK